MTDAQRIAERLHGEACGCEQPADGEWLRFAQVVVDGELTYEQARDSMMFTEPRARPS